jgi:hypothetical protein
MGLFSRKKELPVPSQPAQPLGIPKPGEKREEVNFDKLMVEVPPIPSDLKNFEPLPLPEDNSMIPPAPSQQMPRGPIIAQPQEAGYEAVPPEQFRTPPEVQPSIPAPAEGFNLPDFDDEELERLAKSFMMDKEPEQKTETKPEPIHEKMPEPTPAPELPKEIALEIALPEQKKPAGAIWNGFVDINTFVRLQDYAESVRKLASGTEDKIEQHASTTRLKSEKYYDLIDDLNTLQDKLMLIDSKLFEQGI